MPYNLGKEYLELHRISNNDECCIGNLYFVEFQTDIGNMDAKNFTFLCNTLEDPVRRGIKIPGKTAINDGVYKVIFSYSNRFQQVMPQILKRDGSQPDNFTGIRIHPGNTSADTEGCILVGLWNGLTNQIINSRDNYQKVVDLIKPIIQRQGYIFLNIQDQFRWVSEGQ